MAKRSLSEQLDSIVDAILARPDLPLTDVEGALVPLAELATGLRQLPRPDFKTNLKNELMRRTSMPATQEILKASYKREGFRTVTPYIISEKGEALIDFVKQAFGA